VAALVGVGVFLMSQRKGWRCAQAEALLIYLTRHGFGLQLADACGHAPRTCCGHHAPLRRSVLSDCKFRHAKLAQSRYMHCATMAKAVLLRRDTNAQPARGCVAGFRVLAIAQRCRRRCSSEKAQILRYGLIRSFTGLRMGDCAAVLLPLCGHGVRARRLLSVQAKRFWSRRCDRARCHKFVWGLCSGVCRHSACQQRCQRLACQGR
jgi:hypothetical protein